MAFASIFVPNFMVQAAVRIETALDERPFVLLEGNPPSCYVVAVNERASRIGIECGMTKANAEQCDGAEIRLRSLSQEKTAHAALLDIGWSFSPRIEDAAEDEILVDLSGLDYLFSSKEEIAKRFVERSSCCGLLPNVAIAPNIEAASLAARGCTGITVISPGEEARRLSNVSIGVLPLSEETAETLSCWGVHTCGAFAKLPVLQISERLGQEGVRLHLLARGAGSRSLIVAEQEISFEEALELEDAVEELDPLSFLLGRLLDQLCARLTARSLAAASVRVHFDLQLRFEDALDLSQERACQERLPAGYETKIELPVPMVDAKMLLRLLRLRLQSNPPAAPIQKIAVVAEPARPRSMQGGLFLPRFPESQKLELTLARIANVVGEGNVGSPSLADTHRPDGFQMQRFLIPGEIGHDPNDPSRGGKLGKSPACFRVFRPPVPVRLELCEGRPARVIFQAKRGTVVTASGPWHTSGDWWKESPWQQEEWDLEVDFHPSIDPGSSADCPGGVYRLFYDVLRQGWFVRGVYD